LTIPSCFKRKQERGSAEVRAHVWRVEVWKVAKYGTISTGTIATALYKRGLRNQMIQDVLPLDPSNLPMAGEALTLRYISARYDLNSIAVFHDRNHLRRKAIDQCPPGAVFVVDSRRDARAASAEAILVTRPMKRGAAGVVTDGGFQDSIEISNLAPPASHQRPSAPTNLTPHQAPDINVPIGCGDDPRVDRAASHSLYALSRRVALFKGHLGWVAGRRSKRGSIRYGTNS